MNRPAYKELNRYHWFVLIVAALGWLFDCLDQQLFTLARVPAMKELLAPTPGTPADPKLVDAYGGYATSIFLIGWATGGLVFGVLGDRFGRARIMMITILIYAACTGLSALSAGFWDFAFYRFITGTGVGGEFAVGVALVAEVMPDRARPFALGLLQALSAVGNISAALIGMGIGQLERSGTVPIGWGWRIMFLIGALPALLALVIRARLKEPERWVAAKAAGLVKENNLAYYRELFGTPRWRRNAVIGLLLACTGVIGLWGIGFFSPDLVDKVFTKIFSEQGLSAAEVRGRVTFWKGASLLLQQIAAFFGILTFSKLAQKMGRRPAFALAFICSMLSTALVFWGLDSLDDLFWMVPIMGFFLLSLFGLYAIYFPELFPTHLRSTGTSFCYNVGRFVAASGPWLLGYLTGEVYGRFEQPLPLRYAGMTLCGIFLLGLVVLPFAPETRGQPLPEKN